MLLIFLCSSWTFCSAVKFIHFPGLASVSQYVYVFPWVCVYKCGHVHTCPRVCVQAWETYPSNFDWVSLWILWTLFPKFNCPIHSDVVWCSARTRTQHKANSSSRLVCVDESMYGWIHMHVCIYGYVFTRTRVSLCPSLHKRHAPSTNWSQWNFFVARSTPSFKMKSKWDI